MPEKIAAHQSEWPLIDIGANLSDKAFSSDLEEVLERAGSAGVNHIVLTGTTLAASERAAAIAKQYSAQLSSTAGIHPHYASQWSDTTSQSLKGLLSHPEVKAIGESGLDFNRNFSTKAQQIYAFEAQIELAIEMQLPLFLHERDAYSTQWQMLHSYRDHLPDAVIHCFTGDRDQAFGYLDLGLYIGITAWICDERRGHHLQEFIGDIPLERLMIETDAPYLTPRVKPKIKLSRSGRNEPCTLPYVLHTIAQHSHFDAQTIAKQTTANARSFFKL